MNIGLIGLGTIGGSVAQALRRRSGSLRRVSGQPLRLVRACDVLRKRGRSLGLPSQVFTSNADQVISDSAVDVVIELVGGIHPAREIILGALANGKHVVTANKALLAELGPELFKAAERAKRRLLFEAAVGGGIPIVEGLRLGLAANRLERLYAIINGTCNYVLTHMERYGTTMAEALAEAKEKGFAERDSSLDLDGIDSAHKLSLLCRVGFGRQAKMNEIFVEGIGRIAPTDLELAERMGYCIKLLAIAKRVGRELEARVHPTLLPLDHPLAAVRGVYNAVFVRGDLVGDQIFYGKGAGGDPTASAVISDLIQLARLPESLSSVAGVPRDTGIEGIRKIGLIESRYYMRFSVIDRPGVLAQIARILGSYGISIASVIQHERRHARIVPVVIMTHDAAERQVQAALRRINRLEVVRRPTVVIRVEES